MYNFYPFIPPIPNTNDAPPTIYALLNAYVNGEKDSWEDGYVTPTHLAELGRGAIFDFNYPLSSKISRVEFEKNILNKFMERRIGRETLPAFKIALEVKLNEIMPKYNILFDASINWNLFNDGENMTRTYTENRTDTGESQNIMNTSSTGTSDRRYSNLPQNQISDISSGDYMTDYNLDSDESTSESSNDSTSSANGETIINETIKRSPADKMKMYKDMLEIESNIYTMIYKDLSSLFYGLV